MSDLAQRERRTLCDCFTALGPDAPTCCEGWTTADLAAHLVLRERRPDAAVGVVIPALAGRTERVQQRIRDRSDWKELVDIVRSGPPLLLRPFDEPMNTAEFFIHTEDVRRAQPGWEPRVLEPALEAALWSRAKLMSRSIGKKASARVVFDAPGFGQQERGSGTGVTVTGAPGELLLFVAGRRDVTRVTFHGPDDAVARVKGVKLGM
jgi:uncharacterized protein (TIGR03085 family)